MSIHPCTYITCTLLHLYTYICSQQYTLSEPVSAFYLYSGFLWCPIQHYAQLILNEKKTHLLSKNNISHEPRQDAWFSLRIVYSQTEGELMRRRDGEHCTSQLGHQCNVDVYVAVVLAGCKNVL